MEEKQLSRPRLNEGVRAALRVLVFSRDSMTGERTRDVNALTALVHVHELGLDVRKALTEAQINEIPLAHPGRRALTLGSSGRSRSPGQTHQ